MPQGVSDALLSRLSDLVAAQTGLHFPQKRWHDLERGISTAARELDFKDPESCIEWLLSSASTRSQIEVLASHLTVGESYFFREQRSLDILENHVLPKLIRARREDGPRLRLWSAGCARGEEPYSIAILLSRVIPDLREWNVTILATDINPRFLQQASEGVYGEWSFRATPPWVRERYFKRTKAGRFEVLPHIRKMVTFSQLNLAEDVYPSLWNNTNAMDVVFCRNVLMYFLPEKAKKVAQNLCRSLVESGWLIVSPTEASHDLFSQFVTVNFPGAILYRKDSHRTQSVETFPSALEQEPAPWLPPASAATAEAAAAAVVSPAIGELPGRADDESRMVEEDSMPYRVALDLFEQGQYAKAAEKLLAALSRDPADAGAMALLARVYANQGQLVAALEWCARAVAADRMNVGHHYLRAVILQEQGSWEEARRELGQVLYLDQDFALAHVALGSLSRRQGKGKEARRHFANALSLLQRHRQEDVLPDWEGITAGRLAEILASMGPQERAL